MLAVDIFSKQVEVVPMMLKDKDNILAAFYELFKKLGGNPKIVYSDNDTAIDAPIVQKWFEDQGVKHFTKDPRGAGRTADQDIQRYVRKKDGEQPRREAMDRYHVSNITNL